MIGTTISHNKIPAKLGGKSMGMTCETFDIYRDRHVSPNVVHKMTALCLSEKEYPHE
jgi:hypothetical protein